MNRIYSNIKKIALSLLVVGLAIGFSAYTTTEKIVKLDTFYYGHIGGGVYQLIGNSYNPTACNEATLAPCIYSSEEELPEGFTLGETSEPEDIVKVGSEDAEYEF